MNIKVAVSIVIFALLCGSIAVYLKVAGSNECSEWLAARPFLSDCLRSPAKTKIKVLANGRTGYVPQKDTPRALKILHDMKLSGWSDAPSDDMPDLTIIVTNEHGQRWFLYGWTDKAPFFSRRARSNAGPWFARFAMKK